MTEDLKYKNSEILELLQAIRDARSLTKKEEILENNKDNLFLKYLLKITYSNDYIFNIKNIKIPENFTFGEKRNIISLFDRIRDIVNKLTTTNYLGDISKKHKRTFILETLRGLHKDEVDLVLKVINKNLMLGINIKTINKVFDNLIYTPKYQGASPYSPKLVDRLFKENDYVLLQPKYDGEYMLLSKSEGEIKTETRNGLNLHLDSLFRSSLKHLDNICFMGEILVRGLDRYKANALLNSYRIIKSIPMNDKKFLELYEEFEKNYGGSLTSFENNIEYVVWDILPYTDYLKEETYTPMHERLGKLNLLLQHYDIAFMQSIDTFSVKTKEEAIEIFKDYLKEGMEGVVLKSPKTLFKNGKPTTIVKMKLQNTCDLEVVEYLYGTENSKYNKVINRLELKSSDNKLSTQVAGLKEKEMEYFTKNVDTLIKREKPLIVEVKANGITTNQDKEEYSLLHPAFIQIREDKDEADSIEEIKEIFHNTIL